MDKSASSHAARFNSLPGVIVGVRLDRPAEPVCEDSARFHPPELTSPSPLLILFGVVIF